MKKIVQIEFQKNQILKFLLNDIKQSGEKLTDDFKNNCTLIFEDSKRKFCDHVGPLDRFIIFYSEKVELK